MFPLIDHVRRISGADVVTEFVILMTTEHGERPFYFFLRRSDAEREIARLRREFPDRHPRLSVQMRLSA